MIVPDFWAEARRRHRAAGRQITVRRFGWSLVGEAEALAMAEARADDALARLLAGEPLARREPKMPYNGAAGVPIREEVLARHGEEVVTRNAYGAHCLNSPRALFADIDFDLPSLLKPGLAVFAVLVAAGLLLGWQLGRWGVALGIAFAALVLAAPVAKALVRLGIAARGGAERLARRRIEAFVAAHPAWALRLYRTPSGYRVLATHRPFDAAEPEVRAFFDAVGADPVYVRMCLNQHCFRARLTAKPWRIGIAGHMRPRPGVWPVHPDRLAVRRAWVAAYEARAAAYAACRYLASIGSGVVHPAVQPVIELHDRASRALLKDAPLA